MTIVSPPIGPAPAPGRRRVRPWQWVTVVLAVVVLAVGSVYWLNRARVTDLEKAATTFAVGDCVIVPSQDAPDAVHARRAPCGVDPSYTVGAITDTAGNCPSKEYQRFGDQFADSSTAALCLVPNLLANHCYALTMPVGMVRRADCARRGDDPGGDVLVEVTQRIDAHDRDACPTTPGRYTWPYPSPPRTYCTETIS